MITTKAYVNDRRINKGTLFFPRYHMDVVRKLVAHAAENGVGQTYLIQHSAGSGKSNSTTWTAYRLIETYPQNSLVSGAKDMERPLFESVIVVTDRRDELELYRILAGDTAFKSAMQQSLRQFVEVL